MTQHHDGQNGFTLIELMVTIFVLAILTVIAVPSFRDLIRRSEVSAASNALLVDISYARTEAINRGSIASICPSADGTSCSSTGATLDDGWIVYTYAPGAAVAASAYDNTKPASNLLLRHTGAQKTVSIESQTNAVLSFGPQGQTEPSGTEYHMQTCFRAPGASGHGTSTAQVPGSLMDVTASGAVATTTMGVSADCSP